MCAIMGALLWRATSYHLVEANRILNHIGNASFARGRDGWGYHIIESQSTSYNMKANVRSIRWKKKHEFFCESIPSVSVNMIGNFRAEIMNWNLVEGYVDVVNNLTLSTSGTLFPNRTIANGKDYGTKRISHHNGQCRNCRMLSIGAMLPFGLSADLYSI